MAKVLQNMRLLLVLFGLFLLFSPSARSEPELPEEEEEESSCQGAFDLYFVLDKYVYICFLLFKHCDITPEMSVL